jgi:hypothetical protein
MVIRDAHSDPATRAVHDLKSSTSVAAVNRRWEPLVHLDLLLAFTP